MPEQRSLDQLRLDLEAMAQRVASGDHFRVLGVSRDATEEQVRAAYRDIARRFHADAWSGVELGELRAEMQRVLVAASKAHTTLVSVEKRRQYVVELEAGGSKRSVARDVERIFQAEAAFKQGIRLYERGDLSRAAQKFEECLSLHPGEVDAKAYLLWTGYARQSDALSDAMRTSMLNDVERGLREVLKAHPRSLPAHLFLGHLERTRNRMAAAKEHYDQVLQMEPHHSEALSCLRLVNKRTGGRLDGKKGAPAAKDGFFTRFFKKS